MRGFQAGRLALSLDGKPDKAAQVAGDLPEGATNVAGIYAALRDDIVAGTCHVTGFGHAACLAQVMDAAPASSEEGRRLAANDWPEG
jgi:hypothetical protein